MHHVSDLTQICYFLDTLTSDKTVVAKLLFMANDAIYDKIDNHLFVINIQNGNDAFLHFKISQGYTSSQHAIFNLLFPLVACLCLTFT